MSLRRLGRTPPPPPFPGRPIAEQTFQRRFDACVEAPHDSEDERLAYLELLGCFVQATGSDDRGAFRRAMGWAAFHTTAQEPGQPGGPALAGPIFCPHRELIARRPGWATPGATPCDGALRIVGEHTIGEKPWHARCDRCGFWIGIPQRHQEEWLAQTVSRQDAG